MSIGITTNYGLDLTPDEGRDGFLFASMCRMVLGPTSLLHSSSSEAAGESREVPDAVIEEGKTRASGGDQCRRPEGGPVHAHEGGKIEVYKRGSIHSERRRAHGTRNYALPALPRLKQPTTKKTT